MTHIASDRSEYLRRMQIKHLAIGLGSAKLSSMNMYTNFIASCVVSGLQSTLFNFYSTS
jgi:hypothetical protein